MGSSKGRKDLEFQEGQMWMELGLKIWEELCSMSTRNRQSLGKAKGCCIRPKEKGSCYVLGTIHTHLGKTWCHPIIAELQEIRCSYSEDLLRASEDLYGEKRGPTATHLLIHKKAGLIVLLCPGLFWVPCLSREQRRRSSWENNSILVVFLSVHDSVNNYAYLNGLVCGWRRFLFLKTTCYTVYPRY